MSEDAVHSVCGPGAAPLWPALPPLCASSFDVGLMSNDLEQELRSLVAEHRQVMMHFQLRIQNELYFFLLIN